MPNQNSPVILEIGAYEWLATSWFLEKVPKSIVIAVDLWESNGYYDNNYYINFLHNISPWANRCVQMKSTSSDALLELRNNNTRVDYVYIDGAHDTETVMSDIVNVLPLMSAGGIIHFDDYKWTGGPSTPKPAIDWFLQTYKWNIDVLHFQYQVAVRRKWGPNVKNLVDIRASIDKSRHDIDKDRHVMDPIKTIDPRDPIENKYIQLVSSPSDINEHLPTLARYARKCKHITEMWVRTALSTYAILYGKPADANLVSYDLEETKETKELQTMSKDWDFRIGDTKKINIEETDMLFIDTLHDYDLLNIELKRHAGKVKKYILFHDTTTFGERWETEWHEWLGRAIREFQKKNPERKTKEVYTNNNGLTVLERGNDLKVTVYTAIYWDKDILKLQPEQTVKTRFVCFTDNPNIQVEQWVHDQWDIITMSPHKHLHPRMQAKYYRTHPQEFFDTDIIMRMDGSARLLKEDSIEHFIGKMLKKSDILCFEHPERHCIKDEADFCMKAWQDRITKKYEWLPMQEQVKRYFSKWYPKTYGLTATGLLMTRGGDNKMKEFFYDRWTECLEWCYQDQLSFDYLVRKNDIKRQRLLDNLWNNEYIDFKNAHKHTW